MPEIIVPAADDLVALNAVAEQAGLSVEYRGSVRNAIDAVATAGGVNLDYAGSDRNAIELLAGLLGGGTPYVLRLDDAGPQAAALGMLPLLTDAPDYLSAAHEYAAYAGNQKFVAMPASAEGAVTVAGAVHAFQVNLVGMPGLDGEALGWQAVAAAAISLLRDGAMIGGFDAGIYVRGWAPETAIVEFCLYDYAVPGEPVLRVELPEYESGSTVKIGIYVDTVAGRVGCTMNGQDHGFITAPAGTVEKFMPALYVEQAGDVPDGMGVSMHMLPVAQEITEPVPAGALDCYGKQV